MTDALSWDPASPPLSFRYNSTDSASLLPTWKRTAAVEEIPGGRVTTITYDDPATGLRLAARVRRFDDFPAVEWVLEFENRSQSDSPIIEDILPLDMLLPAGPKDRLRLHHAKGSLSVIDDFLPLQDEIWGGQTLKLAPQDGRSSNGVLPFMNLQRPGGGVVLAVGWSGQWAAEFERNDERLRLAAGMEKTHLLLHAGEKIRTPRILLIDWSGDDPQGGNNILRRLLLAHYMPRLDGELVMPPAAQSLQAYYCIDWAAAAKAELQGMELKAVPKAAELGVEVYWIDASWFGDGGYWWEEVGNWHVNRRRFPQGLRPISDAARANGMKFILWFEPCRVRRGTRIAREHPEFVLHRTEDSEDLLLNFGNPAARDYMVEAIGKVIAEEGVDIYREDYNFDPLPYWRANDEPDRVGMTEIRFVVGHYEFWDELRRRFDRLWIDNCASGGRLIDLETMSRSLPLWPSDYPDIGGLCDGLAMHAGNQCMRFGLARWVPLMGGGMWNFTPYAARSGMVAGFAFGMHVEHQYFPDEDGPQRYTPEELLAKGYTVVDDKFPVETAKVAIAEWKSIRQFFTGDMYLLVPLTAATHDWCAVQFHRPDLDQGAALVFRRHKSPLNQMALAMRAIDPQAKYRVSVSPTYEEAPSRRMAGRELVGLMVNIPEAPGSLLVRYTKV